jgi:translation initiation factor IF-2
MPEKEEEKKEEKKERAKLTGDVEEKRIKPAVIRRRAAKPKPAPETESEVVEAKAEAEVAVPEVEKEAPAKKPKKAAKATKKASKEEAAPEVEAPEVEAKEPEAPEPKVEAKAEAAPEEGPAKEASAEATPAQKKEVKDFSKDAPAKKFAPTAHVFKMGKKRRRTRQHKQPMKKQQRVQASRPLMKTEITTPKAAKMVIRIQDAISVADLSQRLGVKAGDIIKKLMALGIMSTVNQLVDFDSAVLIASDFGFEVESAGVAEEVLMDSGLPEVEEGEEFKKRAPVVTVMGHVDHGKTSLLDVVRAADVVSGEAGGITQHIGAHHVHLEKGDITFLDTPGHEAFTAMRARGAKVTDLVVLVVAADDGVKPQTVEAINHAKAAGVPIIVAINKIDLPAADSTRVRQELTEFELLSEDWGGDTLFVEVSAKKKTNIKELLELILLQSEMLELKAPIDIPARGVIIEANLDKGRGPVATVLIQKGTLRAGDAFVTGTHSGKVRAMISDHGKRIEEAGPSMPIEILGLSAVPDVGDDFTVVKDEATAKQVVAIRERKFKEAEESESAMVSLEELYEKMSKGEVKELNIVVKADVQGSIEAVKDALGKLSTDAITLVPIHTGVGGISEGDCMLAAASNAIVVGFNVRPELKAQRIAETENIDIRLYDVIYDLVDDVKNAMEGMLEPIIKERVTGRVEIRDVIRISKVGNIAGSYVLDGTVYRNSHARLLRDDVVVFNGKISTLKRFKDDVKEVASGYECGIALEGYNDFKVGDVIEVYVLEEEAAKL